MVVELPCRRDEAKELLEVLRRWPQVRATKVRRLFGATLCIEGPQPFLALAHAAAMQHLHQAQVDTAW